jgi:hypothetical protein
VTTRFAHAGERPLSPEKDPSDRSILVGVVATILLHVLLAVLSPQFSFSEFSGIHTGISVANTNRGKTFDFELAPGAPEKERDPFQFVETNPDAPENEPDKTSNFSNRNQQTAQPEPAKELDPLNRPSVVGQDKIKSDAIVTGDMSKPQLGAAPQPESTTQDQAEQKEQKLRMEQVPLSGFDKTEGKAEDGVATNVATSQSPTTHAERAQEGVRNGTEIEGALVATAEARKAQPKARPRLTAALPSVVTTRTAGTRNAGIMGRDARWSEYGAYLAELEEIIVREWYRINDESRVTPPHGSHVTITFKIKSNGETDIVTVEDSEAGKQGVWSCQSAIQARQPYRKWSDQMIAVLGDDQTLVFGFHYL